MSAWQAVEDLIGVLSTGAPGLPAAGHVSMTRPVSGGALPAIVVTAEDVAEQSAGVGRLVGNGSPHGGPTTTSRCSGRLAIELWAPGEPEMRQLAEATMSALAQPAAAAAGRRFLRLAVRAFGPIEHAPLTAGATQTVLRMPIGCSFTHETVPAAEADSDHPIRTIRVELESGLHEVMELAAAPVPPNPALNPPPTP